MPSIYCVRAQNGEYADIFWKERYVAIGWFEDYDLSSIKNRDDVRDIYPKYHPKDTSPYTIGQQVGQIARFLIEMKQNDFIITFPTDTEYIYYGQLDEKPYKYIKSPKDGCPYQHRRYVKWIDKIQRSLFSIPVQYSLRSSLTVFEISQKNSFFEGIGKKDLITTDGFQIKEKYTDLVLNRILELDYTEFELLVTNLLTALGFEAEHVGKVGDDGVDAVGELNLYNMAKIKLYVQAKRYNLHQSISMETVKKLRQNIPINAQGAFITTCNFKKKALKAATEQGFPRIGTINGDQLVDILTDKWSLIDEELRKKLGLKIGLILE